MYLIDTNIFLEVLLDQERRDECLKLMELVLEGKSRPRSQISRFIKLQSS
jgi:predicted nucleic acid-binding protein